jgi:hypothetical protein
MFRNQETTRVRRCTPVVEPDLPFPFYVILHTSLPLMFIFYIYIYLAEKPKGLANDSMYMVLY